MGVTSLGWCGALRHRLGSPGGERVYFVFPVSAAAAERELGGDLACAVPVRQRAGDDPETARRLGGRQQSGGFGSFRSFRFHAFTVQTP